jgi:hypothetical protein
MEDEQNEPDNLLGKQLDYLKKTLRKIRNENKDAGKPLFKEDLKEEVAILEVES